jgi:hypothetical protein
MKFVTILILLTGTAVAQTNSVMKSVFSAAEGGGLDAKAAFWQKGGTIVADRDHMGRIVPGHRTVIHSRWTKQKLYLLFECPYEELSLRPDGTTTEETFGLWEWDVAEAFLGTDFVDIKRYKEFEVSPRGEWVDLDIDLNSANHENGWKWNSDFVKSARIDEAHHIWYAEMQIPWKALQPNEPHAGEELRANFFRAQGPPKKKRLIAWRAPMKNTFHTPEAFGILRLE